MAEDELADARRFGVSAAEGASLRTLGLVIGGADGHPSAPGLASRCSSMPRANSSTRARCSSWERRCDARGYEPRRVTCCVPRSTRPRASEPADSPIARTKSSSPQVPALGETGACFPGRESLTASEDRIAALAAEGLSNREIAQRQFVTVKAVEWHLQQRLPQARHLLARGACRGDRLGPPGRNPGVAPLAPPATRRWNMSLCRHDTNSTEHVRGHRGDPERRRDKPTISAHWL